MSAVRVWLVLGRVSNLPTVWTNVLAATLLAGGGIDWALAPVLLAATFCYEGGMFLNDACDAAIDARERPERPIPSGRASARTVAGAGSLLLALGWAAFWWRGPEAGLAGLGLVAAIVAYNLHHKGVAWSPVLMGACRALLYLAAGFAAVASPEPRLYWAACGLVGYVAGLSYAAKQENLAEFRGAWPLALLALPLPALGFGLSWDALPFLLLSAAWTLWMLASLLCPARRDTRRAVTGLIAGIALLDAVFIAECGNAGAAMAAVLAFLLTLRWQRRVPGT